MFNDMTLNGSVPSDQTSVLLSKLFPDHPIPNTNYTVNIYAVNMAITSPPSTSPAPTLGMYLFDNVCTCIHACMHRVIHTYVCMYTVYKFFKDVIQFYLLQFHFH